MKLIWRREALEDFRKIVGYIAERNPAAADRMAKAINACVQRALVRPSMYRPGRVPGTREAIAHPNYIIVYRVSTEALEVVNVLHVRQRYP